MSQNIAVVSQIKEWFNNIYTPKSHTHNANQINDLKEKMYPIGSIYITTKSDNPNILLGFGYWIQIEDKFLLGTGDTYSAGSTGGTATVTLTANQSGLNTHNHTITHAHTLSDTSRVFVSRTNHSHGITEMGAPSGSHHYVPKIASSDDWYGLNGISASTTTTGSNTATNASEAHNNMPPYITVNVWKRTNENGYQYNNLQITNVNYTQRSEIQRTRCYITLNNSFIQEYSDSNITITLNSDNITVSDGIFIESKNIYFYLPLDTYSPNITITLPSITVDGETFPAKTLTYNE